MFPARAGSSDARRNPKCFHAGETELYMTPLSRCLPMRYGKARAAANAASTPACQHCSPAHTASPQHKLTDATALSRPMLLDYLSFHASCDSELVFPPNLALHRTHFRNPGGLKPGPPLKSGHLRGCFDPFARSARAIVLSKMLPLRQSDRAATAFAIMVTVQLTKCDTQFVPGT